MKNDQNPRATILWLTLTAGASLLAAILIFCLSEGDDNAIVIGIFFYAFCYFIYGIWKEVKKIKSEVKT